MPTLTITARGQVTFRKEILHHLGVGPGEKLVVELLPDGKAALKSQHGSGTMDDFIGCLAGKTDKVASLEELDRAAADGWSGHSR